MSAEFLIYQKESDADSRMVTAIHALLKAAYERHAVAGLRYAATWETVDDVRKNISKGECHLGLLAGELVATANLSNYPRALDEPTWYQRSDVVSFGRFAVRPDLQGSGLGSQMMTRIENRARELGYKELALDTSEKALGLIAMYTRGGFRFIQHHQWDSTNYRSVVMSKALYPTPRF